MGVKAGIETQVLRLRFKFLLFTWILRVEPTDDPALPLDDGQPYDDREPCWTLAVGPAPAPLDAPVDRLDLLSATRRPDPGSHGVGRGSLGGRLVHRAGQAPRRRTPESRISASRADCLIRFQVSEAPLHSRSQVLWWSSRCSSNQSMDSTSTRSASSVAVWKSAGASCTTANRRLTSQPPFPPAISPRTRSTFRPGPFPPSRCQISDGR